MRTKLIVGSLFAFTALSSSAALLDSVNIPQTPQQEAKSNLAKCFGLIQDFRYQAKSPATAVTIFPQTVQIRSLFLLVTPEEKGQ